MDIDPDSGYVSLMTDDGGEKSDLTLPNGEVGDQVKKLFDADKTVIVSVISAMGEEAIVGCKVDGGD